MMARANSFKLIDHSGDIGVIGYGDDLGSAFAQAAEGMFSVMADLETVGEQSVVEISVEASDRDALLVDWLNELLFHVDADRLVFRRAEVLECSETHLRARAYGERIDPVRHRLKTAIKAATYHGAYVYEGPPVRAEVVLDL